METLSCHSNESTWAMSIIKNKNIIYVEANVMNIYAKFQLRPSYGFLGEDFWIFFFENLAFQLPWQPIKISNLDKIYMVGRGLLQKHFRKTCFKISAVTEINADLHFSHYKSMETLSCHSNESTWATTIKNIIYVEASVMNMYVKFQLHPPYGFWGEAFWIFFRKFTLYVAMATNQIQRFGQNSYES